MNQNQFFEKAQKSTQPIIVDFWAPWCAPCRATKPTLEKLAEEFKGKVDFWAINADEHQQLIQDLKIFGIPTVLMVQDGEISGRFTGAQQEENYRKMFESLATRQTLQMSISPLDRILRLGIGAAAIVYAVNDWTWWLLALGLLIMFTGVYDRCPIWKAITGYLKNLKKTS